MMAQPPPFAADRFASRQVSSQDDGMPGLPPPLALATPGFFDDPDDDALIWTATSSHQLDQDRGWGEEPSSPGFGRSPQRLHAPSPTEALEMAASAWSPTKLRQPQPTMLTPAPRPARRHPPIVTPACSPAGPVDHGGYGAPILPGLSTTAQEFVPGYSAPQAQVPFDPHARMTGTIVHLSRRLCGAFTSRRLDGSTATYYNGWYGFVRPDAATLDAEGICRDDLFLHPSDAADEYNPAVGDRVTFRRGVHNGRAKAVGVNLLLDPARRLSAHEPAVAPCWAAPARAVSPDYRMAPAIRGENRHVSLGPRGLPTQPAQYAPEQYLPPPRAHFPPAAPPAHAYAPAPRAHYAPPTAAPPAHW
jgi:hypothetical protein